MSPNLEQTGLLRIDYELLTDLCAGEAQSPPLSHKRLRR